MVVEGQNKELAIFVEGNKGATSNHSSDVNSLMPVRTNDCSCSHTMLLNTKVGLNRFQLSAINKMS